MKNVLILVEGQTEEEFIKKLLVPKLGGLVLIPIIVKTRTTGAQPKKGGTVSYSECRKQLHLLLRDPTATLVSTLLDYQGLGRDFPGRAAPAGAAPAARVSFVEAAMKADLGDSRYLPFLALHEFEALLFSRPEAIAEVLRQSVLAKPLKAVRDDYGSPEEINDSPATSPSARIERLCEEKFGSKLVFQKRLHGPTIAEKIGLATIREQCPHFSAWLTKLEALAATATSNPDPHF